MFENVRIPAKLDNSPIKKAVIEFKYESSIQEAAIYGLLLTSVFNNFPRNNFSQFPVVQIPEELRKNEPSLKYQIAFQSYKENSNSGKYLFGIGAYTIQFAVLEQYVSWDDWMSFVNPIMNAIKEQKLVKRTESIHLQYQDVFDKDVIDMTNTKFLIDSKEIKNQHLLFRTTFKQDDFDILVNIGNSVNINGKNIPNKSLIDIDCLYSYNVEVAFVDEYQKILDKAHLLNKRYFFGLISDALLNELGPHYGN
ncbi:TIGR04255 family protein [uncultured Treponema sp.]|uniref:TIGR04255 family protein n=1 Tax=uncultured Treponema sp. TaxID=162155 RepID=UPI00258EBF30|nr:TIGR04255 family protein [uncultured Treponema sp.]